MTPLEHAVSSHGDSRGQLPRWQGEDSCLPGQRRGDRPDARHGTLRYPEQAGAVVETEQQGNDRHDADVTPDRLGAEIHGQPFLMVEALV